MYSTRSIQTAAFLLAKGRALSSMSGPLGDRTFHFDYEGAEAEAQQFYQNATVVARLYAAGLNDLKKLVHQPQSNPITESDNGRR